jgi:phosphonate transport system substrate-binding protein
MAARVDIHVTARLAGCSPSAGHRQAFACFRSFAMSPTHRLVILVLLFMVGWARAENAPLRLGIMPFNSTLALLKTHQPLRQHLEAALGRPVEIYTAADYAAFHRDSLAGGFDLLITGPHFGVMCLDKGYVPLFHYKTSLKPIFVVGKAAGLDRFEKLRGKRIGLSNRLSVSSIVGLQWLAERGLHAGQDFEVIEKTTHGAAIAAVAVGDLDAALTTFTPLKQVPADVRDKVDELPTNVQVPHLMTLAHNRLGAAGIDRLRQALRAFPGTPEGQAFFRDTGYLGYDPVEAPDIQAMKPYVPIVKKMMGL